MAGRPEGDLLGRLGRVRCDGEVGGDEVGHVDEVAGFGIASKPFHSGLVKSSSRCGRALLFTLNHALS